MGPCPPTELYEQQQDLLEKATKWVRWTPGKKTMESLPSVLLSHLLSPKATVTSLLTLPIPL